MSQDWDIKPRGDVCSDCNTAFEDKQSYFSMLVFADDERYNRADFCKKCWLAHQSESNASSSWQGTFLLPPPPPDEALKKETAEHLLRRLMQDEDDARVNVIYILAVMLERKRILIERDIQHREDGTTIRVYEHRGTGETFLIPEPYLRLDQLEHVQEEVVTMLGGKPKDAVAGETQTAELAEKDTNGQDD